MKTNTLCVSFSLSFTTIIAIAAIAACTPETECSHLTDCPGALVCSSEGTCVISEAPFVPVSGGSVAGLPGRADPNDDDSLLTFATTAGFAGELGGTEFADPSPVVEGTSEGYVAWQLTTEVPGGSVGMWFDIPMPELLPVGEPRVFTLEEMFADGTLPCISLWGVDGVQSWADDYVMTQYPEDKDGNVLLEIDASNSEGVATASLVVPALH